MSAIGPWQRTAGLSPIWSLPPFLIKIEFVATEVCQNVESPIRNPEWRNPQYGGGLAADRFSGCHVLKVDCLGRLRASLEAYCYF
jgi:hypothetical protein